MSSAKLTPIVRSIVDAGTMSEIDARAVAEATGSRVDSSERALLDQLRDGIERGQIRTTAKPFDIVESLREKGGFMATVAAYVAAPGRGVGALLGVGDHRASPGAAVTAAIVGVLQAGVSVVASPVTVVAGAIAGAINAARD